MTKKPLDVTIAQNLMVSDLMFMKIVPLCSPNFVYEQNLCGYFFSPVFRGLPIFPGRLCSFNQRLGLGEVVNQHPILGPRNICLKPCTIERYKNWLVV
jgi:hypothetical protein